jgi:hypothetical protein
VPIAKDMETPEADDHDQQQGQQHRSDQDVFNHA